MLGQLEDLSEDPCNPGNSYDKLSTQGKKNFELAVNNMCMEYATILEREGEGLKSKADQIRERLDSSD